MNIPKEQQEMIGQMHSLKAHKLGQQHMLKQLWEEINRNIFENKRRTRDLSKTDSMRSYYGAKVEALNEILTHMKTLT